MSKGLTEETVGPGTPGKLLRTMLVALALVAVANLTARALLDSYSANRGYWLIRAKWHMVLDRPQPVDYLVLGDSACNQGVRPDIFDPIVGGRSMNLCTIANVLAVNDAWMLDAYLARNGPPKAVVLVHVYDMWHRGAEERIGPALLGKIPLPWGFWKHATPPLPLDAQQTWVVFASRYLPLYGENESLARWIRDLRTFRKPHFYIDEGGYMPVYEASPEKVRADTAEHQSFVRENRFALSDDNRAALDHIVELADERGFEVYFADSPMHDELARDLRFIGYHLGVRRMVRDYVARSRHVHHALPDPVRFPETLMENSDHVIDSAAQVYTRALANAIRAAR